MAVRTLKNQYQGVNAHLHSLWQAEGGWGGFHTAHIGDLNKTLKAQLLPMGYTTDIAPSVQIRRAEETFGEPKSDVSIYDLEPLRSLKSSTERRTASSAMILPVRELILERPLSEKPYKAIGIYELIPETRHAGGLVGWLELLSPSNKGRSRDAKIYRKKRLKLLRGGVVFIELDYLHETPATFSRLVDYQHSPDEAHPYRIAVIDPRPDFETGQGYIQEFDVDEPIPVMEIPLNAGDILRFDFGVPYRKTFEESLYGLELVDYSQLPLNFRRYSAADQLRIVRRMLTVLEAAQQGKTLEDAPLPLTALPESIEAGLERLRAEFNVKTN